MKTQLLMKAFSTVLMIGIACCFANSQTTVKSISSEKTYTEKQIFSILGTPEKVNCDKYKSHCAYYYEGAHFFFLDGCLVEFSIETNKYSVMTDKVSGGIKVGDNISKVKKIKNIVCQQLEDEKDCYVIGHSQLIDQPDYLIYVKNDIITKIIFVTLD